VKNIITALLVIGILLAGCTKQSTFIPAPRSLDFPAEVEQDAKAWAARGANRFYAKVAPTGSMEPFINEHSIVLCVKYTGQPLQNGAVVIYKYSPALPRVIHTVSDQNETAFYASGYANHNSDGWQQKSSIEGILVGQLYTP